MCLAIPGQVIEMMPEQPALVKVDVGGVRRNVNVGLFEPGEIGDRRLDPDPRRVRAEQDQRNRSARAAPHAARDGRRRVGDGGGPRLHVRRGNRRTTMMKYVDEFRDPALIGAVAHEIRRTVDPDRHYRVMEVCGGHTHAIYRHGLRDLLPENVELVHGPGCPVCVLPTGRVDDGLTVAAQPDTVLTCFGDMMRVPGTKGNAARTQGPRRRHSHGLLAARCAQARAGQSRPARLLLRDRVRDDGAVDRARRSCARASSACAISRSSATT